MEMGNSTRCLRDLMPFQCALICDIVAKIFYRMKWRYEIISHIKTFKVYEISYIWKDIFVLICIGKQKLLHFSICRFSNFKLNTVNIFCKCIWVSYTPWISKQSWLALLYFCMKREVLMTFGSFFILQLSYYNESLLVFKVSMEDNIRHWVSRIHIFRQLSNRYHVYLKDNILLQTEWCTKKIGKINTT